MEFIIDSVIVDIFYSLVRAIVLGALSSRNLYYTYVYIIVQKKISGRQPLLTRITVTEAQL